MILDIKHYIFNPVPSKPTLPKSAVALVAIDHQIVVLQVQVQKNFIKCVLLDGGSKVNIIMKKLTVQLGFSKPKPTPYNLCMADQNITKPLSLIKGLKILIHKIPYVMIVIII